MDRRQERTLYNKKKEQSGDRLLRRYAQETAG